VNDAAVLPGGDGPVFELPPRPYPGLRPFDTAEWPIFFGRERVVDAMLARLVHQRVVFVHGDSGCGKSSLVRAGLFARLLQGGAGEGWRVAIALPRQAPLWNLAEALARLASGLGDEPPPDGDAREAHEAAVLDWRRALNAGRDAPAALAALYARSAGDAPGCLLIDQFEELFQHAHRHGAGEARLLTEVLVAWQADPPAGLYLTTTMRSEYLGACARFGRFAETVNASQYLLPPMAHADLLRAVREPARLYGGEIGRELAERLVADAGGSQDQLPLMQHALMRLHALHVGAAATPSAGPWRLGIEHFPPAGGCAALLSAHADEVRAAIEAGPLLRPRLVEDVFRALTDTNAEGHAIRRPQTLAQLADALAVPVDALRPLVDAFRADGVSFLVPPPRRALRTASLVDIGHEALIRCWQALEDPREGWLIKEFRAGLVWRSLLVQAESFERDPANVLAPATTGERERFMSRRSAAWARRYGGGWERVERLMAASVAAREQAERERVAARRHRQWRNAVMAGVPLVLLAVALLLMWQQARYAADKAAFEASYVDQYGSVAEQLRQRNELLNAALAEAGGHIISLEGELERQRELIAEVQDDLQRSLAAATRNGAAAQGVAMAADRIQVAAREQAAQASAAAAVPVPSPAPGPERVLRLFIHIVDPQQREAAIELAGRLQALRLEGWTTAMPTVELVKSQPSQAGLRCFAPEDCKRAAAVVMPAIQQLLRQPTVVLEDLGGRTRAVVRPGTYELWFTPGEIQLR
jgi:hypothetical protein